MSATGWQSILRVVPVQPCGDATGLIQLELRLVQVGQQVIEVVVQEAFAHVGKLRFVHEVAQFLRIVCHVVQFQGRSCQRVDGHLVALGARHGIQVHFAEDHVLAALRMALLASIFGRNEMPWSTSRGSAPAASSRVEQMSWWSVRPRAVHGPVPPGGLTISGMLSAPS